MTAKPQPADLLAPLLALVAKWRAWPAGSVADNYQAGQCWAANSCASELQAAIESLAAHRGEVVAGRVNGYLPRQRAIEFIIDGPIPEWLTHPNVRAYVSGVPTFEAIGRKDSGHNADWCAGWNAHLIATSHPPQAQAQAGAGEAKLMKEAAEVLQMIADSGVELPANWRWPLLDELSGAAAIAASEASHEPE